MGSEETENGELEEFWFGASHPVPIREAEGGCRDNIGTVSKGDGEMEEGL